jgi:hypothetical protein
VEGGFDSEIMVGPGLVLGRCYNLVGWTRNVGGFGLASGSIRRGETSNAQCNVDDGGSPAFACQTSAWPESRM